MEIHHRDTEDTEVSQRTETNLPTSRERLFDTDALDIFLISRILVAGIRN